MPVIVSCGDGMGDCPEVQPFFSVHKLNSYGTNRLSSKWDEFAFYYSFEVDFHSQKRHIPKGVASLYALSCLSHGHSGSKQQLDTLYFITLDDYNENYQSNDTLNLITEVDTDFQDFAPLESYVQDNKDGIRYYNFALCLKEEPAKDVGKYRFKLVYILKDETVFEVVGKEVDLYK